MLVDSRLPAREIARLHCFSERPLWGATVCGTTGRQRFRGSNDFQTGVGGVGGGEEAAEPPPTGSALTKQFALEQGSNMAHNRVYDTGGTMARWGWIRSRGVGMLR